MGVHILSPQEIKALFNDTIAFETVNGVIRPKEGERYTVTAPNFYGPTHIASIIGASASLNSPVIAEISYGSMKGYANSNHMEDGAALIRAYFDVMRERKNPLVVGDKEVNSDDAVVGVMVDHHKFLDYFKKSNGSNDNEKYLNAKQQFLSDIEATFNLGGDVFSLLMVDAAEGTTYEQNVDISRAVLELANEYGKVVEIEYSATGGLGEEGSGKHAADMSPEEYPTYIQSIYQFVNDVTQGIGSDNLTALAFDFGTEHVARAGEVLVPKYDLLEQYQIYGLEKGKGPYPVVGHGGSSLGNEEVMRRVRGLLGKVNKATELKRGDLEWMVEFLDNNRGLINANIAGLTEEEASQKLGRKVTKKEIDDTHHPKNVIYGPQTQFINTVQWYMQCLGSAGKTPGLYQRGIISR